MTASGPFDRSAGAGAPVDLDHLARQTMGNRDLEREVLGIFLRQIAEITSKLSAPGADRAMLAHTLLGSARGIGAHDVADAALRLETAVRDDHAAGDEELRDLEAAAAVVAGYIRGLTAT